MREESLRPPLELPGRFVRLVPLSPAHRDDLARAGDDPRVAQFLGTRPGPGVDRVAAYIEVILGRQRAGTDLAFVVTRTEGGRVLGATRYTKIDRPNDSVAAGTWLTPSVWRTPVNSEVKYLLLRHAFEVAGAHRVAFETDLRNERSQRALERIGALREGVLREDRLADDGYRRSSVVYSVLVDEWPRVRPRLERFLARPFLRPEGAGA